MNLIKKTSLALGLIAAAGVSYAQNATASNGLLGQRFAEISYVTSDLDSTADYGHDASVSVNLPLTKALDVGAGYTYSWLTGGPSLHGNSLYTYATAYTALDGAKPFVSAAVGYTWASLPFGLGDDDWSWNVSAGVEIPFGAFTVTPKITYADDFNGKVGNSDDVWVYSVEANYWLNAKTAVFGSAGRVDQHRSSADAWTFGAGVRFKF